MTSTIFPEKPVIFLSVIHGFSIKPGLHKPVKRTSAPDSAINLPVLLSPGTDAGYYWTIFKCFRVNNNKMRAVPTAGLISDSRFSPLAGIISFIEPPLFTIKPVLSLYLFHTCLMACVVPLSENSTRVFRGHHGWCEFTICGISARGIFLSFAHSLSSDSSSGLSPLLFIQKKKWNTKNLESSRALFTSWTPETVGSAMANTRFAPVMEAMTGAAGRKRESS